MRQVNIFFRKFVTGLAGSILPVFLFSFLLAAPGEKGIFAVASADTLQSGPDQVSLLELYTSEGCSSCPSADRMISELKSSPGLWNRIVPVAFHVDYWDYLGWVDRMANKEYGERQRDYIRQWNGRSTYTPMLVNNGEEFRRDTISQKPETDVGYLSVEQDAPGEFMVVFRPSERFQNPHWRLETALLGFGISSKVATGENAGKVLAHDFTVLDHQVKDAVLADGKVQSLFSIDLRSSLKTSRLGLAAWVHPEDDLRPVQAVGGWLSVE